MKKSAVGGEDQIPAAMKAMKVELRTDMRAEFAAVKK